ncbi:MAG: hypothetical protein P1V97_07585, partial [Planctomycetota bacterium]|nr:hypothetical protein [Planctomycetota bacterium]
AFAKDPSDRYESVTEFLEDCERARVGDAIVGKAPAAYKRALRNFHASGAAGAIKVLLVFALIAGLGFVAWGAWERKKDRDWIKQSEALVGKTIPVKRFRKDFIKGLAQRLLAKTTGHDRVTERPGYLHETSHLESLSEELSQRELEASDEKALLDKILSAKAFSKTWDGLESLNLKHYGELSKDQIIDQEQALAQGKKDFRDLLLAGHHFYLENWDAVRPAFKNQEANDSYNSITALFRGLTAYLQIDDAHFNKELGEAHDLIESEDLKALRKRAEVRELVYGLLVYKDRSILSRVHKYCSQGSEQNRSKRLSELNRLLEQKMREQSRDDKLPVDELATRYLLYFDFRLKDQRLVAWPLEIPLLKKLIFASELRQDVQRALLYSYLLYQRDPKANLSKYMDVDKFKRPRLSLIVSKALFEAGRPPREANTTIPKSYDEVVFSWILLFSRYGVLLPNGTSQGVRKYKDKGILNKLLEENPDDLMLRFWRGLASENDKDMAEVNFAKRALKEKKLGAADEGKRVWKSFVQSEGDIEFALRNGRLSKMFRAMAVKRLVSIRRNKIRLGIAKNPNQVRDEGLSLLKSIKWEHPSPYTIVKAIIATATVNRKQREIKDQVFAWIDERERLLKWQWGQLEKFQSGELKSLDPFVAFLNLERYKKELKGCSSGRAYLYSSLGDHQAALKHIEIALNLYFSYTDSFWCFESIKKRKSLKDLLVLQRILNKLTDGRLKDRGNDDNTRARNLLKAINKTVQEYQSEKK